MGRISFTPRKQRAFTLIELLVVIAIIAILAAILFPVFAQAREKARQASCLSNQKQLGIGFMMYVQDYDEKFPGVGSIEGAKPDAAPYDRSGWANQVYPYVKNVQVYSCPSDSLVNNTYKVSYSMNYYLYVHDWGSGTSTKEGASLAMMTAPASTFVLYEAHDPYNWDGIHTTPAATPITVANASGGTGGDYWIIPSRHDSSTNKRNNYMCGDGHVKFLAERQVSLGNSREGYPGFKKIDELPQFGQVLTIRLQ